MSILARVPSPLMALEFLTVTRVRRPRIVESDAFASAQLWYPSVGLIIGLSAAGIDRLIGGRILGGPRAMLVLLWLEGVTGLLHLDGLADSADGLFGLHSRERRLEIMRDSCAGAFGVAAVGFYLLLAYVAIAALAGAQRTPTLIAVPVVGRAAMVAQAAAFPYARSSGLGVGLGRAARSWYGFAAAVCALLFVTAVWGPGGAIPAAAGVATALAVGAFSTARLGGVTGDVYGAGCEVAQVAALTVAGALQSQTWFRPWL